MCGVWLHIRQSWQETKVPKVEGVAVLTEHVDQQQAATFGAL